MKAIVEAVKSVSVDGNLSPETFVDICLDQLSIFEVSDVTRQELVDYAGSTGDLVVSDPQSEARILGMLQLIVTSREFQLN